MHMSTVFHHCVGNQSNTWNISIFWMCGVEALPADFTSSVAGVAL